MTPVSGAPGGGASLLPRLDFGAYGASMPHTLVERGEEAGNDEGCGGGYTWVVRGAYVQGGRMGTDSFCVRVFPGGLARGR